MLPVSRGEDGDGGGTASDRELSGPASLQSLVDTLTSTRHSDQAAEDKIINWRLYDPL